MLAHVPFLGPNSLSPNRVSASISRLASSGIFVSSHQGRDDESSLWKLPGGGACSCSQRAPISCATFRGQDPKAVASCIRGEKDVLVGARQPLEQEIGKAA